MELGVEPDGRFITLKDAKDSLLTEENYAHCQYPHHLANLDEKIIKIAQADLEIEMKTYSLFYPFTSYAEVSGQKLNEAKKVRLHAVLFL